MINKHINKNNNIYYMSIDYTPNNTFIFCFVRMNPPTPGHLSLIGGMINKALEFGTDKIFILTSSSMDGKNPVPCDTDANPITNRTKRSKKDDAIIARIFSEGNTDLIYKKKILDDMINSYKEKLIRNNPEKESQLRELKIIVVCSVGVPGNTIYSIIQKYFTEAEEESVPKINLIFFGGRDRADFVDQIIDNNKTRPYINSVDGEVMGREGMAALIESGTGERDVSDIKESEFSASYVRNLVNHKKKFMMKQMMNIFMLIKRLMKFK